MTSGSSRDCGLCTQSGRLPWRLVLGAGCNVFFLPSKQHRKHAHNEALAISAAHSPLPTLTGTQGLCCRCAFKPGTVVPSPAVPTGSPAPPPAAAASCRRDTHVVVASNSGALSAPARVTLRVTMLPLLPLLPLLLLGRSMCICLSSGLPLPAVGPCLQGLCLTPLASCPPADCVLDCDSRLLMKDEGTTVQAIVYDSKRKGSNRTVGSAVRAAIGTRCCCQESQLLPRCRLTPNDACCHPSMLSPAPFHSRCWHNLLPLQV